jgi:predicted nucleic acid-binding protein
MLLALERSGFCRIGVSRLAVVEPHDIVHDTRLVLDTDVVLSGLRSTSGASRVLLHGIEAGIITPLVSVAMVIEYEAVLKRTENLEAARVDAAEIDLFLDALIGFADHVVPYFAYRPSIRDPNDEIFVAAAKNGGADALVSFNVTDYLPADNLASSLGLRVCRPADILRRLNWRPSATLPFAFRHR